jgi:hypothetical protein
MSDQIWFFTPTYKDLDLILKDLVALRRNRVSYAQVLDYANLILEFSSGWDTVSSNERLDDHPMEGLAELLVHRAERIVAEEC